jgi:hypothetical protein
MTEGVVITEFHDFCDMSEKIRGGCIYIYSTDKMGLTKIEKFNQGRF